MTHCYLFDIVCLLFTSYVWQPFPYIIVVIIAVENLVDHLYPFQCVLCTIHISYVLVSHHFHCMSQWFFRLQSNFPMCHILTTLNEHTLSNVSIIVALTSFPINDFGENFINWFKLNSYKRGNICVNSFLESLFWGTRAPAYNNVELYPFHCYICYRCENSVSWKNHKFFNGSSLPMNHWIQGEVMRRLTPHKQHTLIITTPAHKTKWWWKWTRTRVNVQHHCR